MNCKKHVLALLCLTLMGNSVFASEQTPKSSFMTKVKAAVILGMVGLAQLVQGQQVLPSSSSSIIKYDAPQCLKSTPFVNEQCMTHKQFAKMLGVSEFEIEDESSDSIISESSTVSSVETKTKKESKVYAEMGLQMPFKQAQAYYSSSSPDHSGYQTSQIGYQTTPPLQTLHSQELYNTQLQESLLLAPLPMPLPAPLRQQAMERRIENDLQYKRYVIYKQRYPVNFQSFLQKTNEKKLTQQVINKFITNLAQAYPSYFADNINMLDIGCGEGEFSSSMVATLSNAAPKGTKAISFVGIDPQVNFVKNTHNLVSKLGAKTNVMVGDFMKDSLQHITASNFIIASHSAYSFADIPKFIEKVQSLLAKNGFAIFLHNGDTPVNVFRKKFPKILKQPESSNIVERIDGVLKDSGLFYTNLEFTPILKFPRLTDKEWDRLRSVTYADFTADYSDWKTETLQAKRILEFFIQDPLEAFTPEQRTTILDEFKKLLKELNYEIPQLNTVQIVAAKGSDKQLHEAIKKAVSKS